MDYLHDFTYDCVSPVLKPHFPAMDKDDWMTQSVIYYFLISGGCAFMYFFFSALSYYHTFEWNDEFIPPTLTKEKRRAQVKKEIALSMEAIIFTALYLVPPSVLAHRGHAKLYKENPSDLESWGHVFLSLLGMLIFTDFGVYFIHRACHHPLLYKFIHKPHHQFQYPTPFASLAFDALDGFGLALPYYAYIFLFPMHTVVFLGCFVFSNLWTISVHDQVDFGSNGILNSTGHHSIHHSDFIYNFGQYTTIPDRLFGTYKPAVQTHDLATLKRVANPSKIDEQEHTVQALVRPGRG